MGVLPLQAKGHRGHHQKLGRVREGFPPTGYRGSLALPTTDSGIPASSTTRPSASVLRLALCGSWLWQLRKLVGSRAGERGHGGRADRIC